MPDGGDIRFAFGRNWHDFVARHYSPERLAVARDHLLSFLDRTDLKGLTFVDIGSGSGLHSLAAHEAGAERIVSFDYDANSVETTASLHRMAGSPANWTVQQGSVLDRRFLESLGQFDIVYSWGVLHHTGAMSEAIRNLKPLIAPRALVYLALYATEAYFDPPAEYWLATKQRYNRVGWLGRRLMEAHYTWRQICNRQLTQLARLPQIAREYQRSRGMALYTDIKDWLGGWPMEFASAREIVQLGHEWLGLEPVKIKLGEGNTEYLFSTQGDAAAFGQSVIPTSNGHIPALKIWPGPQSLVGGGSLWIYSAGGGGLIALGKLRKAGVPVNGFVDTFKNGTLEGLPVRRLSDFAADTSRSTPIIIAHPQAPAIYGDLLRHGFREIYDARPMISTP